MRCVGRLGRQTLVSEALRSPSKDERGPRSCPGIRINSTLFIPLDVHHVLFVSAGGDNSPANLVPLCPLCHRVLHESGKLGRNDVTPELIRGEWERWLSLGTLTAETPIGNLTQSFKAYVRLNIYHVTIPFVIGQSETYAAARQYIIAHVLRKLEALDEHCPFSASVLFPHFWDCTAERIAPAPWDEVTAQSVLAQMSQPMNLIALIPVVASAGDVKRLLELLGRMDRTL